MDVTTENFRGVDIDKCLQECSFVAVDTEFTGLRNNHEFNLNYFDTPEDRFRKYNTVSY